jgi:hypothetical protein
MTAAPSAGTAPAGAGGSVAPGPDFKDHKRISVLGKCRPGVTARQRRMLMKRLLGAAFVMALAAGPALAQPAPVTLKQPDQDFLTKASEGNISEIKPGRLAMEKGSSSQVKTFGRRMVNDR